MTNPSIIHRLREGEGGDAPRRKYKRKCKEWPRCSCIVQGTVDDCLMPIWAYVPRALITAKETEHDR